MTFPTEVADHHKADLLQKCIFLVSQFKNKDLTLWEKYNAEVKALKVENSWDYYHFLLVEYQKLVDKPDLAAPKAPAPAKTAAPKKVVKEVAKKVAAVKAAPKKAVKEVAKKVAAVKTAAKKAVKKVAKKVVAAKAAPKKAVKKVAKKVAAKKAAPKKAVKKVAKKVTAKKAAPKKAVKKVAKKVTAKKKK
jgi:hypothetical protein